MPSPIFSRRRCVAFLATTCLLCGSNLDFHLAEAAEPESHQANGVKIGEVTPTSAVVWTRVTQHAAWNTSGPKPSGKKGNEVPADADVPKLLHAAPGMPGRVRVGLAPASADTATTATQWTAWSDVTAETDFAHSFALTNLTPGTEYRIAVETSLPTAGDAPHAPFTASFRTAPRDDADVPVRFCVMTCQAYKDTDHPDGFEIYRSMLTPRPDFIVPNGDIVYYDSDVPFARTISLARYHWNRMYGFPRLVEFHRQVPGYWTKDDHDSYDNDVSTTSDQGLRPFTYADGLRVNREQLPYGDKPYRTFRWGKRLQIWLTEGREFRSGNGVPDGPEKTIWGEEQKRWFQETVAASDADWKVLVSPTPLVGPDRGNKHDNHANDNFQHEGNELRDFLRAQGVERMFVVCGDRHWQYHSVDPRTGVHEFSAGAASDEHAGGSPGEDAAFHRFHRVKGGYLGIDVAPPTIAKPGSITFRHYDVEGAVVYEKSFTAAAK
jgi:alkaline phosphatase D